MRSCNKHRFGEALGQKCISIRISYKGKDTASWEQLLQTHGQDALNLALMKRCHTRGRDHVTATNDEQPAPALS